MSGSFGSMALVVGNNYSPAIDTGAAGALVNTAVLVSCDTGLVFAGQGSLSILLQDSPDGVSFFDFRSMCAPLVFTTLAAGNFAGSKVPTGVRRYLRLRYAVGGSSPTGTVSATLNAVTPDVRYPSSFEVL